jgi:hypothetical protein
LFRGIAGRIRSTINPGLVAHLRQANIPEQPQADLDPVGLPYAACPALGGAGKNPRTFFTCRDREIETVAIRMHAGRRFCLCAPVSKGSRRLHPTDFPTSFGGIG